MNIKKIENKKSLNNKEYVTLSIDDNYQGHLNVYLNDYRIIGNKPSPHMKNIGEYKIKIEDLNEALKNTNFNKKISKIWKNVYHWFRIKAVTKEKIYQIIKCKKNDLEHKKLVMYYLKRIVSNRLCDKHGDNYTILVEVLSNYYIDKLTERYFYFILRKLDSE